MSKPAKMSSPRKLIPRPRTAKLKSALQLRKSEDAAKI
jgi:hypothetical protein